MKKILWIALCMVAAPILCALADKVEMGSRNADGPDTVSVAADYDPDYMERLPGTYPVGTLDTDTLDDSDVPYAKIAVAARTYGDSVVLRWAVDKFPQWLYLNLSGYTVIRHDEAEKGGFTLDTLAVGIRPWPLDKFRTVYPDTIDSIAYLAMGSVHGTGDMTVDATGYEPGSMGVYYELEQDQQTRLMGAYLAAEWRPDLATALGLRFVDRTAKRNGTYSYYVVPTRRDTTGSFLIENGMVENLVNERYKPKPYDVTVTDTVTEHCHATLMWNDTINGTFDIFYRKLGEKEWTKINERPYMPPFKMEFVNEGILYNHIVDTVGTYEYAVQAHDAFGDLTPLSSPHRIVYRDLKPPKGPAISLFEIIRPGKELWDSVMVTVHFHKDFLENDFVRYVPMYANARDSMRSWRLLTNQYIAPEDTTFTCDVTNLTSGYVTIAAVDTAGNMGYSLPRYMHIQDFRPPCAPTNLKGLPELDGSVVLMWDMEDSLDVQYYDIYYSNSREHQFTRANGMHVGVRSFNDTIDTNINERYIYYCVRAVDWSDNPGPMSDTIAVLRPNTAPPSEPHLDSAWVDNHMIHTRWVGGTDEIISHYNVYRRKAGAKDWTLHTVFNGDSVAANGYFMQVDDEPGGNIGQRWEYAVETVSLWDIHSRMTPVFSAKVNVSMAVDIPIKLYSTYDEKNKLVRLVWEYDESLLPQGASFYYCLYRKEANEESFRYVTDIPSDKDSYEEYRLSPGESAQYYVSIRFRDGRSTGKSNIITATVPGREASQEKPL